LESEKRVSKFNQRDEVAREILATEKLYLTNLQIILTFYQSPLQSAMHSPAPIISEYELRVLFSDIETIIQVNKEFHKQLNARVENWNPETTCIGDIFQTLAPYFNTYKLYCSHYDQALQLYHTLLANNPLFFQFIKKSVKLS